MKPLLIIISALMVSSPLFGQRGCFTIVAGKATTVDGSVLFGHNEDNARKFVAGMKKIERRQHRPDELIIFPGGARIPQVKTTWSYWWLQMPEIDYSDGLLNEHGVAVVSNNCRSREDKPEITDGGVGGPLLRRLVVERARSAREGVELVGALIAKFGYTASGRMLIICDPNEGWLVAMVNGKHWLAARVADDQVALIANTYTIGKIDMSDSRNFMGSPDIIDYAIKRGWYDPQQGAFSFEAAYASPTVRNAIGNTHRQWSGLRRLAAASVPLPEKARLPFAIKPRSLLSVSDLIAVLRDHYEDTPYEPASRKSHKRHTATICASYTNSSSVFQLRSQMPAAIGNVWWLALWQPCVTPYFPIYFGMDRVPDDLAFRRQLQESCVFCEMPPEFGPAYRLLADLSHWVNQDYESRAPRVRATWQAIEKTSFALQSSYEKYLDKLLQSHPNYAGKILGRYCQGIIARVMHHSRELLAGQ